MINEWLEFNVGKIRERILAGVGNSLQSKSKTINNETTGLQIVNAGAGKMLRVFAITASHKNGTSPADIDIFFDGGDSIFKISLEAEDSGSPFVLGTNFKEGPLGEGIQGDIEGAGIGQVRLMIYYTEIDG